MDNGFGEWQLYSACRLTAAHYYEPGEHRCELFGTGFIVEFPNEDNRFGLVTNRHLVDVPWAEPEKAGAVITSVTVATWLNRSSRVEFTIDDPQPLYHDDPTVDVAVIPCGADVRLKPVGNYPSPGELIHPLTATEPSPNFTYAVPWDYLLECETLWPQINPGEFVAFPGYPEWYDKLQTRPVLRSGMIASDPHTEYRRLPGDPTSRDGIRQVLFDAFSTSGNSGSPVFVAQRGVPPMPLHMMSSRGGFSPDGPAAHVENTGYHRSFLIGINTGHINISKEGRCGDTSEGVRGGDHAGLSRMHKLSAIMDILRANATPSPKPAISMMIPAEAVDSGHADGGGPGPDQV